MGKHTDKSTFLFYNVRSMPVPDLETCDVFHIVCLALDQLGGSIALDPRRFPSGSNTFSSEKQSLENRARTDRKWEPFPRI